jgi:hypothetical protein
MILYLAKREESYVTSILLHQTTRRHITEHNNIPTHHRDRLKYHSVLSWHWHSMPQSSSEHTVKDSITWEGEIGHTQGKSKDPQTRQMECRSFRGLQFLISTERTAPSICVARHIFSQRWPLMLLSSVDFFIQTDEVKQQKIILRLKPKKRNFQNY